MPKKRIKYLVGHVDLFKVRNRNETRVIQAMNAILASLNHPELGDDVIYDAYALALNSLPARYTQTGSIVLRDPVKKAEIEKAVAEAMHFVLSNPR